jgi:hypothetical protein
MKHKASGIYFLLLAVFMALVFAYQYFSPKPFNWRETFYRNDKQPFGSYVFDDVVSSSVSDYRVINQTFYQIYRDELATNDDSIVFLSENRKSFLVTESFLSGFGSVDMQAVDSLLMQGHKIMLCLGSFPFDMESALWFEGKRDYYASYFSLYEHIKRGYARDLLFFGADSLCPEQIYAVYPQMHTQSLREGSPDYWYQSQTEEKDSSKLAEDHIRCDSLEILVRDNECRPVAMRLFMGEGELFLVATPLMFTNYGILDEGNASYAFRLLSYLADRPVIRIEGYNRYADAAGGDSPLRYLLQQPPLRWALYASLATIVLFMIFTARRRQRVIPVVHPPANETLRFTQLIGNLYYQRKDYKDMIVRKYLYFTTEVKRLNGLDLQTGEPDEELARRLAERTGQDFREVWSAFRELRYLLREGATADENDMIRNINRMNDWIRRLGAE